MKLRHGSDEGSLMWVRGRKMERRCMPTMSAHSSLYTDADEPRKERYVSDACDFFLVFFFCGQLKGLVGYLEVSYKGF